MPWRLKVPYWSYMVAWMLSVTWMGPQAVAQNAFSYSLMELQQVPSRTVYDLLVDSEGYLWLGSDAGLSRFDGSEVRTYASQVEGSRAVTGLFEDAHGKIWCNNFSGELLYLAGDSLTCFVNRKQVGGEPISIARLDTAGRLVVAFKWHLRRYDFEEKMWATLPIPSFEGDPLGTIFDLEQGADGSLYAIAEMVSGKTYVWKAGDSDFQMVSAALPGKKLLGTYRGRTAALLAAARGVVPDVLAKGVQVIPIPDEGGLSHAGGPIDMRMAAGRFWIVAWDGARSYDSLGAQSRSVHTLLSGYAVSDVVTDREGNTWFSTLHAGVFMVPSLHVRLVTTPERPHSPRAVNRMCLGPEGDLLLARTNGVIQRLSPQGIFKETYAIPNGASVLEVAYDAQHRLILAGGENLNVFQVGNATAEKGPFGSSVKKIDFLADGRMLVGSSSGPYVLGGGEVPVRETSWLQKAYGTHSEHLNQRRVSGVHVDRRGGGGFWVAYQDELVWYASPSAPGVQVLDGGKALHVAAFAQEPDGTLWVGTLGQGIYSIHGSRIVQHLGLKEGLMGETVRAVEVEGSTLYLGTDRGLQTYVPGSGFVSRLEAHDGLPRAEINDILVLGDEVWLATGDGLAVVQKGFSGINAVLPPAHVRGVAIHERDTVLSEVYRLSHRHNNLRISLGTISYRSQGSHHFSYRLWGLDSNWIDLPPGSHIVRFPSLPPGDFLFEATAVNEDGFRSAMPARIRIVIAPAVWQQWWFWPLIALALAVMVFTALLWRVRALRRGAALEQEKAEADWARTRAERARRLSELAALRSQMNPHFIYNMLNTVQSFMLANEKREANRYLGKFSRLMRMTLEFSRQESVLVAEEVEMLNLYLELESLRFGDSFTYLVQFGSGFELDACEIPPLMVQPFVENAVKHGLLHKQGSKSVAVKFEWDSTASQLICTVEDNGIGRQRSAELQQLEGRPGGHNPFAMAASSERLKLINETWPGHIGMTVDDLRDAAGLPSGTRVTLRLPVQTPEHHGRK